MRHHKDCVPLYGLIKTQLKAEKMSYGDLLRGMSYGNMAKAERRLQTLLAAEAIIDAAKQKRKEAIERKNFVPHAVLVGTYSRPTMIAAFALTGGTERWLKVALDTSQPPTTFAQQMKQYNNVVNNIVCIIAHNIEKTSSR